MWCVFLLNVCLRRRRRRPAVVDLPIQALASPFLVLPAAVHFDPRAAWSRAGLASLVQLCLFSSWRRPALSYCPGVFHF
jgi:hypothetical protein